VKLDYDGVIAQLKKSKLGIDSRQIFRVLLKESIFIPDKIYDDFIEFIKPHRTIIRSKTHPNSHYVHKYGVEIQRVILGLILLKENSEKKVDALFKFLKHAHRGLKVQAMLELRRIIEKDVELRKYSIKKIIKIITSQYLKIDNEEIFEVDVLKDLTYRILILRVFTSFAEKEHLELLINEYYRLEEYKKFCNTFATRERFKVLSLEILNTICNICLKNNISTKTLREEYNLDILQKSNNIDLGYNFEAKIVYIELARKYLSLQDIDKESKELIQLKIAKMIYDDSFSIKAKALSFFIDHPSWTIKNIVINLLNSGRISKTMYNQLINVICNYVLAYNDISFLHDLLNIHIHRDIILKSIYKISQKNSKLLEDFVYILSNMYFEVENEEKELIKKILENITNEEQKTILKVLK